MIAQQNLFVVQKPRETSCFIEIFQHGTQEMISDILQTQEITNSAREHIAQQLENAFLFLTKIEGHKNLEQAELLKSLAQENNWEVTFLI